MVTDQVQVRLHEATERGRLYYYRDPQIEKNIIYIQNNIRRQQTYSINISNLLILGIDARRFLKSVEVIFPRRAWIVKEPPMKIQNSVRADIEFLDLANKNTYIELPVAVNTDQQKSYAHVMIGTPDENVKWIALSNHCFVLINDSLLNGFFIDLKHSELEDNPSFRKEKS